METLNVSDVLEASDTVCKLSLYDTLQLVLQNYAYDSTVQQPILEHIPTSVILQHGELFRCIQVQYWFMEPNACHDNVLYLYERHKIKHMCIGYALAPDRKWRYHSWGLGHNGRIVETTAQFLLYFGCIMVK